MQTVLCCNNNIPVLRDHQMKKSKYEKANKSVEHIGSIDYNDLKVRKRFAPSVKVQKSNKLYKRKPKHSIFRDN